MEFLDELENMVAIAAADNLERPEDNASEIARRWQQLFGYTETEAHEHIQRQLNDLNSLVSIPLWNAVKEQQENLGHDRRSYSHWLQVISREGQRRQSQALIGKTSQHHLIRLEGPISSPEKIAQIAGLSHLPVTLTGESSETEGKAKFCRVDSAVMCALMDWVGEHANGFRPLFIAESRARKDFRVFTIAPTLGIDSTLPQHRLDLPRELPGPGQDDMPVYYFFYGTLADKALLQRLFEHIPRKGLISKLIPAYITRGRLRTWGNGRYKALVDGDEDAVVHGHAFLVQSKEQEDALCFYETNAYEVVRCVIYFDPTGDYPRRGGCTFRFIGEVDENS